MPPRPPAWDPGYPIARRFSSDALFIGEWRCPGSITRPVAFDRARHFEVSLQGLGSQTRQTGRERAVADPAHVVIQHPGDEYRVSHPVPEPERSLVLLVGPAVVAELTAGRAMRARSVPLSPRAALARRELGRALAGAGALAVEDTALAFLDIIVDDAAAQGDRADVGSAQRVLVEDIQHELARRYRDKPSLGEIADAVGVSPSYASRVFRRTLGIAMHRYLVRLRLFAALEALDLRRGDWTRLALEVGFASHSHFTDAFVRELGLTPRDALHGRRPRALRVA